MDWTTHPLASRAQAFLQRWELRAPELMAATPTGLLLTVQRAGGETAVLKCLSDLGVHAEGDAARTLLAFDGRGAVRVLDHARDALLLEHCAGGDLLAGGGDFRDEDATPIICDVVRALRETPVSALPDLPTLADRCEALDRRLAGIAPDDARRPGFEKAAALAQIRLKNAVEPAILHGDLHHANILRVERSDGWHWVTIDPQPLVGDPVYELANTFGNPLTHKGYVLDPTRPRRLASAYARELGIDAQRLIDWAYIHCLISAAWSIEDGEDPSFRIEVAGLIEPDISL
ncbi:MAG: aminoglycoside phosphotransferase family protein [Pseudomonadota bacterium]